MPDYTNFKGVSSIGDVQDSEYIVNSVVQFFDWAFLNINAFYNINIPTSGYYSNDLSVLRPVKDPRLTSGKVWQSQHANWIWQTGLEINRQPINISGIFIDGVFTTSGYNIDYTNGRVIFDTAQSTSSVIRVEHSYKMVNVYNSNDTKLKEIHSSTPDNLRFTLFGSGEWNKFSSQRTQVPAVIIEVGNSKSSPYAIGTPNFTHTVDLVCRVFAENKTLTHRIADIIEKQYNKTIYSYDMNRLYNSGTYPLTLNGYLNSQSTNYPVLVDDYRYRSMSIIDTNKQELENLNGLYHVPVRIRIETEITGV